MKYMEKKFKGNCYQQTAILATLREAFAEQKHGNITSEKVGKVSISVKLLDMSFCSTPNHINISVH